ncbi:MAG: NAD(P)H-dependent oxidoreductase [Bacteroidales bacterium]|nr:NAD(P)H-dependent oxidoreductase [Bacteroidales bacterium]
MKILIINGSPKGKYSTTLHSCLFLEKKYPEHSFSYLNAGVKIKSLEKDFSPALEAISSADLIVFSYPVYTFLAPSQLHRFIELMKESGVDFSSKIATQITTSKHFYDITAHRFVTDNCADMGIRTLEGFSADMDDILTEKGRKQVCDWFEMTQWRISPAGVTAKDKSAFKAVIVADFGPDGQYKQLKAMVDSFVSIFPFECDVIDIQDFPFQGGCISCFNCASTGKCFYKDGFDDYLRNVIHKHDAILYAFKIKDHSMGTRFKIYDDRQFCNGHRTVTMGTPFGYIVDGDYSKEENLRMLLEARAQVGGNFLAGVATTEAGSISLTELSNTVCYALEHKIAPPQNFLGVGGMKIFRDLIYQMRGMMRADHKFFKSHGQYDFPQKKWKTSLLMYLVGWMMGNRSLKAKMGNKLNEGMISAYKKVVDEVE